MNLILALPYHSKDAELLEKNLQWMFELNADYRPHSCLLVADFDVPHETKLKLQTLAKPRFNFVETMVVRVPESKQKWPDGSNVMFGAVARQIQESFKLPWLWFEPDAVPLKRMWLDVIADVYEDCPKRFMGSFVPSNGQADMPPVHMAGCGVYPPDAYTMLQQFTASTKAFDIAAADYIVPRAVNFEPMQHFWGKFELPPTFVDFLKIGETEHAVNVLPLSFIKSDSVTFHRCKDGSLIDLLRRKANSQPVKPVQTDTAVPAKLSAKK